MKSVADLGGRWGRSPPMARKIFRFFPAERIEKRLYTTSDEPQKVILTHDRPTPYLHRENRPTSEKS